MSAAETEHATRGAGPRRGRVLAIDYGRRRIGLAISDARGTIARPLETLTRTNRRDLLGRLGEIVRENDVRLIVVGDPARLDGTASVMSVEAAQFAARMSKTLGVPVERFDERLTSWEANERVREGRVSAGRKKRRGKSRGRKKSAGLDAVAAAILLTDYLSRPDVQAPLKV